MNSSIDGFYYRVIIECDMSSGLCFAADSIQEAEQIIDFIEEKIDLDVHPAPYVSIIRVYFVDDTEEGKSEHTEPAAPPKHQQAAGVDDALSKLAALKPAPVA